MPWNDDSWRDGYDAWKLRSPDDEYYRSWGDDEPEEECDHEDFETNSEGRRSCCCCEYSWWPTKEEVEAEQRLQREHDQWQRREEWRQHWRDLTSPLRWLWFRALDRIAPRQAIKSLYDDEIPF